MAHEELKKQYETDCNYFARPWEMWEYRVKTKDNDQEWRQLTYHPKWGPFAEYRRKEWEMVTSENDWENQIFSATFKRKEYKMAIPRTERNFEPEFFSGLNYQKAEKLIGKKVGFSDNPNDGWRVGTLAGIRDKKYHFLSGSDGTHFDYIRTCPETYEHPTITLTVNGRKYKLPRPETEAPENGAEYWVFSSFSRTWYTKYVWLDSPTDQNSLKGGFTHLTEDRAQEWADWWDDVVVRELK